MKILVTGFKPFLGAETNPSEILALRSAEIFSEVDFVVLPVEFANSFKVLKNQLIQQEYDFLIMLGQAAGRTRICFEKIGLNWIQTEHQDEAGHLPRTGSIHHGEPLALMSVFPVDQVYLKLKNKNLPVDISFSAGAFVCNDLYYRVLRDFKGLKAVFIHVPLTKDLSLKDQFNVLSSVINELLLAQ